jgi:hypothetical protein
LFRRDAVRGRACGGAGHVEGFMHTVPSITDRMDHTAMRVGRCPPTMGTCTMVVVVDGAARILRGRC